MVGESATAACPFRRDGWGILRYLEDSEDLKVGVTELQEQLGMSEEARISVEQFAQQARNENGQFFFEISRQAEVCIASWAR